MDLNTGRSPGNTPNLTRRSLCAALPAVSLIPGLAKAQTEKDWMAQRPVRMVVPFPPGGGVDVVARLLAQALGTSLGQPVVVDNKPGASGALGTETVYNEKPDGHTIEVTSNDTHSIYPHVNRKIRYKADEFTPVAPVIQIGLILMANPRLKVRDLQEVMSLAKQRELNYATWGVGTSSHVAMEMLRLSTGMPAMLAVAYKGSAPAIQAVLAGEVDLMMVPTNLAGGYLEKLAVIGVASPRRSPVFKSVPTLAEQGAAVDCDAWIGVVGPPRMPAAVADAIHRAVQSAIAEPGLQQRLRDKGMQPQIASRAEFASYLANEYRRWGEVVRSAKIVLDE
jgi:tripartite-type tricarboxylate transporter receptor subunit TctC